MRMIVLSALLALGLGFVGATGVSAATLGAGIDNTVHASTLIEKTALICRRIRVCRRTPYGLRCHWRRVCRRVR